jgi:hypothetical protein
MGGQQRTGPEPLSGLLGNSSGITLEKSGNILENEFTINIPDDGKKYYFAVNRC